MDDTEEEIDAVRSILFNWAKLTAGEISIINAVIAKPESRAATMEGSEHFRFWANLERLGWARREDAPMLELDASLRPAIFVLTRNGCQRLPSFMAHYDLQPGTYYLDARLPPFDPGAFDRAVADLETRLPDRHPRGLTLAARVELRMLDTNLLGLAIAAFAYDVKESLAAFLAFLDRGDRGDADTELRALRGRIRGWWSFQQASLPALEGCSLHDCAAGLGAGLDDELAEWLYEPTISVARVTAWLKQYGPRIDSLLEHVKKRAGQPAKEPAPF
jgi:hypothetical protein